MAKMIVSDASAARIKTAVVSALEVSGSASSKATHYHSADEQKSAVREHMQKLYSVGKELPLIVASLQGARGYYVQEALLNEFEKTMHGGRNSVVSPADWKPISNTAIEHCIANLDKNAGTPYVLRMFVDLKERKINNARTRRVVLSWIWGHEALEFISVKYRAKLRTILTHIYGSRTSSDLVRIVKSALAGTTNDRGINREHELLVEYLPQDREQEYAEKILLYIFGAGEKALYPQGKFRYLSQVYRAHEDVMHSNFVPEEVLVGILSNPEHPQHDDLWATPEKQAETLELLRKEGTVETANQAVRKTKQEKKKGIKRESRVAEATDPIALLKTYYENPDDTTVLNRLAELAEKNKYKDFPYQNIGIVTDRSISMRGHHMQSKNTPRAVAQFTQFVLEVSCQNVMLSPTETGAEADLAEAFIGCLNGDNLDAVFILSDGYENSYEGLLNEVISVYNQMESPLPVYHVSPIGGSEVNAKARNLGSNVASIAATWKSLPVAIQAGLLEADTRQWLANQVQRLESGE